MKYYLLLNLILLLIFNLNAQDDQDRAGRGYSVNFGNIDTIANLLNLNVNVTPTLMFADGLATSGDGLGGILRYDRTSSADTNAITIFKPLNYNGRWIKMSSGASINTPGFSGYFSKFNFTLTNYYSGNILSNEVRDVFTVPEGKRIYIQNGLVSLTNNLAGCGAILYVKTNSIYYPLTSTNSSVTTNTGLSIIPQLVLEAGESFSVKALIGDGMNVIVNCLYYDNTIPIYSPRLKSLSSGDNILYTAPANTYVGSPGGSEFIWSNLSFPLSYANFSGTDNIITVYTVASGTTSNSQYQRTIGTRANTLVSSLRAFPMLPGDSVIIKSSSTANLQFVWTLVAEVPYR